MQAQRPEMSQAVPTADGSVERRLDEVLASRLPNADTRYRACKSRARKRGWGQLGAGGPYTPC